MNIVYASSADAFASATHILIVYCMQGSVAVNLRVGQLDVFWK